MVLFIALGIGLTLIQGGIVFAILAFFVALLVFVILLHAIYSIQPYEIALVTVLGSYKGYLNPGFNVVNPVAKVFRVDLRTQVLEVPRQEVITKDNSPTNVDAIIYIKVVDGASAVFRVQDYRLATVALAQTTLRSVIGDMELDEILYNRETINARLRDILDEATDKWGVRVEAVEIKEVDPVGPVKAAMEEQTAAERQRRAAVLRADGEKRSAILVSEGSKRSRILQAEGVRQSKILEAEGTRMATILEAQGEAQRLRIMSMGAAALDAKALTVLSLDTATSMAAGQATKILFPFEFTRLMEGASEYLGVGRTVPERSLNDLSSLERTLGTPDDVLGPIPRQEELATEVQAIEEELKAENVDDEDVNPPAPPAPRAGFSAARPPSPAPSPSPAPAAAPPAPAPKPAAPSAPRAAPAAPPKPKPPAAKPAPPQADSDSVSSSSSD
ncbi:MAG: SPFH/Band 7/PHB domain protein [Euryarchaeota archaeon]|nr:SPFH/Band 7/PHB domain protein [Euryarchaeota archaeon]MDE1835179.1 SPFH/Band 7/PHB domain protein [Euryarchaeota archaeon]MDE1880410.1 SPFH/Band 7/PHB domain protein [Euryarchaeota archaeon]MDE2045721.1 SPFH/Band 7/PHB domain protein [Thermoplasmata archaeon]